MAGADRDVLRLCSPLSNTLCLRGEICGAVRWAAQRPARSQNRRAVVICVTRKALTMANKPESAEPNESPQSQLPEPDQLKPDKGLLTMPAWQILLYVLLAMAVLLVLEEFNVFGF